MSGTAVNARFENLTVVRDGDGYILGSPHAADFLAVPELGGLIVTWLRDGVDVAECEERAAGLAGEPVDVAGFIADLDAAGLLDAAAPDEAGPRAADVGRPPRGVRLGKVLFGRTGLAVQALLAAFGAAVLVTQPQLRPTYTDAIVTDVPLVSILAVSAIGIVGGLMHELAHFLAAAAKGVPSSISMGRRLYTIVYQTDLSRLWSLPRRERYLPLAAGMISDAATTGLLLALLAGPLRTADPLLLDVLQAVVFAKFSGIVFQLEVFMRTDLYAILSAATGCHNLWTSKGAMARKLIGRATPEDLDHLDKVSRNEIRWAKVYLALYVPGVAWATWYFVTYALPALWTIVRMSATAVADNGLLTPYGGAGAVALVLAVVPTSLVVFSAGRSGLRVLRAATRGGMNNF